MSDDQFDAIVVGGGIAGCTAAYLMANAGLEVLVIERGNYAGSKNMTGGRLYAHSLERIIPGFATEAPVERRVVRERISFLTPQDSVTMEYATSDVANSYHASYTVLRAEFDQWLMSKAEEAGAQLVAGVRVDELLRDSTGKVTGVRAGDEELFARVVVLADGVNSILGEQIGMVKPVQPESVAVGAKELIELPAGAVNERFNLQDSEGLAWLFAGTPSNGKMGGGFLYTNKDTVSLGVVCGLSDIANAGKSVPQMLEDFKLHPAVQPLIKDGKLIEYSGHLVPEGGLNMVPKLYDAGVVIVGDAAGLCLNVGYTIRGMDLAVASAEAAAQTIIAGKTNDNYSEAGLSDYKRRLEESFVLKDMKLYSRLPHFLEHNPRMFSTYPQLAADVMKDLFCINGIPERPIWRKILSRLGGVGFVNLLKDGINGVRSL